MTMLSPVKKSGFVCQLEDRTRNKFRKSLMAFNAPFTITYGAEYQTDSVEPEFFNLTVIQTPTRPGWSRAMIVTAKSVPDSSDSEGDVKAKTDWRRKIFSMIPRWLVHILSNRFLDSDLALLHYQEQERDKRGGDLTDPQNAYFMPAAADMSVNAFRKWKNTYASVLLPLPPAIQHRATLYDHYSQHTDHCIHCSTALKQIKKLRVRVYGLLAVTGLITAAKRMFFLGGMGVAGCLLTILVMNTLEREFYTGDFRHYEND